MPIPIGFLAGRILGRQVANLLIINTFGIVRGKLDPGLGRSQEEVLESDAKIRAEIFEATVVATRTQLKQINRDIEFALIERKISALAIDQFFGALPGQLAFDILRLRNRRR